VEDKECSQRGRDLSWGWMWRKSSATFGLHISGIILNPACFDIFETAVKGELTWAQLAEKNQEAVSNGCGLSSCSSCGPTVSCYCGPRMAMKASSFGQCMWIKDRMSPGGEGLLRMIKVQHGFLPTLTLHSSLTWYQRCRNSNLCIY